MKITIEIDDADLADFLGRLGLPVNRPSDRGGDRPPGPIVRPFAEGLDDDEPAPPAPARGRDRERSDGPPGTGRELLGWIRRHGGEETQQRAMAICRGWGLPTKLLDLDGDQVEALFRELQKPARGRQKWGS